MVIGLQRHERTEQLCELVERRGHVFPEGMADLPKLKVHVTDTPSSIKTPSSSQLWQVPGR